MAVNVLSGTYLDVPPSVPCGCVWLQNVLNYVCVHIYVCTYICMYRCADKSLPPPGRKQVTATEDFDFHISHL